MKGSRAAPGSRRRRWARVGVLLAFAAGAVAGVYGWNAYQDAAWTPQTFGVLGGALVALALALAAASRKPKPDDASKPLPGDVYGDREAPEPQQPEDTSLDGIPFSESKDVTAKSDDPRRRKLEDRLEKLNKELQRANVKLGLGELSREGYSKIVEQIKERRAQVEAKLAGESLDGETSSVDAG